MHYLQLALALAALSLCLFAFSVTEIPSSPREYWGRIATVCALSGLSAWTYAKLKAFSRMHVEWRSFEMRFLAGSGTKTYRFDEIETIKRFLNWKIRFVDGRELRLDPNAVGSDQLIKDVEKFLESFDSQN